MKNQNLKNSKTKDILEEIFESRFEELDQIIIDKTKNIKNGEEKDNIKKAIIMKEMYMQGFKDGVNLIIACKIKNN